MKTISFIRVGMFEGKSKDAMKPLIFPIIESLTPDTFTVTYWDDRVEVLPEEIASDIIAFSTDTFSAKRAYHLAGKYKNPDNIIVMGGFHPSTLVQESLEFADVVTIGDAEDTWPAFLDDYLQGTLQTTYCVTDTPGHAPMAAVPNTSRAFGNKKYLKLGIVQFSRGCKNNCDFCAIKTLYPDEVRQKPIETIVEEIRAAQEKLLFFIDDNLFFDESSAKQLFEAIKPLKKKWACQISLDIANKDDLLDLMRASGCILVLIGFESLNPNSLKAMNKSTNLLIGDYKQAIANIYKHRLMIYGTFVLGYDADGPGDISIIRQFAQETRLAVANFNPLIPIPGTRLYERLQKQNRLLYDRWWLSPDFHYGDAVFKPANMRPEELRDGCRLARYRYYSPLNMIKRFFANPIHLIPYNARIYWMLNIISLLEIRRKQGRRLGGGHDEADPN